MRALALLLVLTAAPLALLAQTPAPSAKVAPEQGNITLYNQMTQDGFSFPVTYTGEVLGNPVGGFRQGAIYDGLLEAGIQVDLDKFAHWPGLTFTADAYYPHGASLTRNDVHDLNVVSNIDAFHDPRLYELWLQQVLLNGGLSIRAGQIPLDTEFSLTAYGGLFVNSAFGASPVIALNMNAPVFPAAAPGVRIQVKPNDNLALMAGLFDGNTGSLNGADRYGTNFNFSSGLLCIAEADYTLNPPPPPPTDAKTPAPTSRPLSATYKIGGFLNTQDFSDVRTGAALHGDYGFYALADQELWHQPGAPDQGLRGFCRFSCVPADRNLVNFDIETGLNYAGLVPGRAKDLSGLGFAYTKVSNGVPDDAGAAPARHYESILEATYQAALNDHLSIQPDAQYVFNPGGGAQPLRNALVLGLRFNMTF